jgi:hypothetical protein
MDDKPAAPDDPMELVGVALPAGPEATLDMAYVFAEELARLGFDEARLLRVFRSPFYAAPHRAYRALGEPAVRRVVAECVRVFGQHTRGA